MDMCLLLLYLALLLLLSIYFHLVLKIVLSEKALSLINTKAQKTKKIHRKNLTKLPSTKYVDKYVDKSDLKAVSWILLIAKFTITITLL